MVKGGNASAMIKIGNNYKVEGSKYCLILLKRRIVKKTKEVTWDAQGYFTSLEGSKYCLILLKRRIVKKNKRSRMGRSGIFYQF